MANTALNSVLTAGFLAVSVAVWTAFGEPATAYEESIYTETPDLTWLALVVVFAVALGVVVSTDGPHQRAGILLGGLGVLTVASLPVIRSYRFLGKADPLTHLGWTRDIVEGEIFPHELYYPALHSLTSLFADLGGLELERAMMVVVVVLLVPFLAFVPLVARQISGRPLAVGLAAAVSWFVLPVNNVATHFSAHTNTNALFFVPVVLFATLAFMRRDHDRDRFIGRSSYSVLLLLTGGGLLLIHPQQMVNVVIVLGTIALIRQSVAERSGDHPMLEHSPVGGHAVVLGVLFLAWSIGNERFRSALYGLIENVFSAEVGASAEVEQRGASLAELGGSLPELFVTMFGPDALIGLAVAGFALLAWTGRTHWDPEAQALVTYCTAAIVPLGVIFILYFLGTPTMAFRQLGFIYVLVTILAGLALASVLLWICRHVHVPTAHAALAMVLAVCLVLGLVTLFASPLLYEPNQQSTDAMAGGYETTLAGVDHDRPLVGLGYGVDRYDDAIGGVENRENPVLMDYAVDPETFEAGNYTGAFVADEYYFVTTAYDEYREFVVYQELHHSESALLGLEHYPGSVRAVSSDEFNLYRVTEEP